MTKQAKVGIDVVHAGTDGTRKVPVVTKQAKVGIDVVHAGTGGTRKVSNYAKCPLCHPSGNRFKAGDAVVRIRDYNTAGIPEITVHRRCIEAMLRDSVEDEPVELTKFEAYRHQVAESMGIPVG